MKSDETYIRMKAHHLVRLLFSLHFISPLDACRIAHRPLEHQAIFLVMSHRAAVERFVRQYSDDGRWLFTNTVAESKELLQEY